MYEYKGFNDANLFYTKIVPFKNIQDFERMMDQNKIDFDKNIYVHEQDLINFEETLTEGSTKRIEIKKGKISLDLRSSGTSILLLPVEFRNAYEVTSGNAKIFRANIFLTALYFKGDVNIEISLHPGLFDTSAGIYSDVKDLKKFNFIPGRVKYPKDYQPESNFEIFKKYKSWGRANNDSYLFGFPKTHIDLESLIDNSDTFLASGKRRSYGDVCFNSRGVTIDMTNFDKVLSFDKEKGIIKVQAGITIDRLLRIIVPDGWFIQTSPGTKFVSIGGALPTTFMVKIIIMWVL